MQLTEEEEAWARGESGPPVAMATRILAEMGRILGADRLIPVTSAQDWKVYENLWLAPTHL